MAGFFRDVSLLWSFLHILVLFLLLFEPRLGRKKATAITLAAMVPLCLVNTFLVFRLGGEIMSRLIFLTMSVPSLVFFFFMSRYRDGRFFFTFCFADTIGFEIIAFTTLLDYWVGGDGNEILLLSRLVLFPLVEIIVGKYMRAPYLQLQKSLPRGWSLFAVISLLFYVLLAVMFSYPAVITLRPDAWLSMIIVFVMMPLTYAGIISMLFRELLRYTYEEQQQNMLKQTALLQSELEIEQEYVAQIKRNRHDVRHSIGIVRHYLEQEDYAGAKQYLADYEASTAQPHWIDYCKNPVANALIRLHARSCIFHGTKFTVHAVIPEKLPYNSVETSALFGNLLENAREAAAQCSEGFVELKAECKDDKLYLELRNSVEGTVVFDEDFPVSTKTGGGIGVRSVSAVLEKYGGMMEMTQENGVFITRIIQKL